jgi:hypothetical protein
VYVIFFYQIKYGVERMARAAWMLLTVSIIAVPACAAPNSGPEYEAEMKAAMLLLSFDGLAAQCAAKGGFAGEDAPKISAWKSANAVDAMRARTQILLADPKNEKDLRTAVDFLNQRVAQNGIDPCTAAVKIARTPEAQFATLIPNLAGKGAKPSPVAKPRPTTNGAAKAPPSSGLAARIDSFGFDTKAGFGMGGFITTEIYPVVLFRDGTALTDVKGLADPEAHRSANPENWIRWRRANGKVELAKSSGWKALPFPKTYASLPAGFRLDGLFRRSSGVGNVAVGGSESVSAVSEYRFWPDGAVVRGGSLGASAASGSSSVFTSSVSPNARGTYRIDGLTLSIAFDDGSTERRILVADPSDPKTAIWLDGYGYVQRRR